MLSNYPNLEKLRLSQIPLFDGKGSSEVRPQVIARIPQLSFFNGSKVTPRERVEAEKSYLREIIYEKEENAMLEISNAALVVAAKFASVSVSNAASIADDDNIGGNKVVGAIPLVSMVPQHPRYSELYSKYGADLIPTTKSTSSEVSTLKSELVTVTFRNLSFGSNGSLEPITKKIPRSLIISRLRLMVKQLFGLEPRMQDLSLRNMKDGSVPVVLDDDKSALQYYGIVEGAEIFVHDAKEEK